jgi:hypothetical protein
MRETSRLLPQHIATCDQDVGLEMLSKMAYFLKQGRLFEVWDIVHETSVRLEVCTGLICR